MAIMTRMRDNMHVILIGLVVAFVLLIIFEWGMDYLGLQSQRANFVGRVNSRTVSYEEFTEMVRQASEQSAQNNPEADESQMTQIREQVWNTIVDQTLLQEEMQRMNIVVTDEEIVEWVHGANPPEFLRRQFIDSTGVFNRAAYDNALRSPENREAWIAVDRMLREQRAREKLQSLLYASVRATESEIFQRFVDQNVKLEAEYVLFDPNRLVKDEEVEVAEEEIKKFYAEKAEDYKVEATRKLKHVRFSDSPSTQDTQSVVAELDDILRQVREGADFIETAGLYGEIQTSDAYFKRGELGQVKEDAIFQTKVGDVVGPTMDVDGFHLIKILDAREGKEEFIKASHILISIEGGDSTSALRQAREILAGARRGENFQELATKHSKDPGSAARGGDLGWFGRGRMVKEFEEAAFRAKAGQIVGPVRTPFGYHVIKVESRSRRELKIADFHLPVSASSQTRSNAYQNALDFAYLSGQGGFEEAARQLGFQVQQTTAFTRGAAIPGIGLHQSLSNFAFEGDVGDISETISIQNGHGVFMIDEVNPVGVKPLEEVREAVRFRVLRQKKLERVKKMAEDVRSALGPGDSFGVALGAFPDLQVQQTGEFSQGTFVPGLGRDLAFLGVVSALQPGEISKPFEGVRGYFLVRLLSKTPVDSAAYQAERQNLMAQITQEKRSRFVSQWLEQLKKDADIEDNRDLFYR